MSTEDNQKVDEWLSQLNDLQPADGKFTLEIIEAAGPFPVYRPPGDAFDNRNDPEKSLQHFQGSVARRYALEMATYRAQRASLRSTRSTGDDIAKHELNAVYWSRVVAWLKTIQ